MGCLELSERYFDSTARPSLEHEFPELYGRLAAGLVGNGSECFGFDDELSLDHDCGADFFIWVTDKDRDSMGALIQWKKRLLVENPPDLAPMHSVYGIPATVMCVDDFYRQLIGVPGVPQTLGEWVKVPEENFAMATNGRVFYDGAGQFTEIREDLLGFLPDSLRKKRIASWCMAAAQTGQYNHLRMAQREEWVVVRQTISRFTEASMALVFLLNRRYRPYYKWTYRMLLSLPILGTEVGELLMHLARTGDLDEKSLGSQHDDMESICALIIEELHRQGLSFSDDRFLAVHGEEVQAHIKNEWLRSIPTQFQL